MSGMHISVLVFAAFFAVADDAKMVRYGIPPDLGAFSQKTPQDTLDSVLKAAEMKRFDYLTAQLADPVYIDERVQRLYGGRFAEQVDDLRIRLDGPTLGLLRRYRKDGAWQVGKENASVSLKEVADRTVSFRLANGRWFMEHRAK
jgi:hypothetical protein